MAELSITRHENRVSVVGDVRSMGHRDLLDDESRTAIAFAIDVKSDSVVLDVAHAGYVDARALFTLQSIARRCVSLGLSLVLEGANEELQEQLRMTGLDQILRAHGTEFRAAENADGTGAEAPWTTQLPVRPLLDPPAP